MKTPILASILLLISLALNAQIEHEHLYSFSGSLTEVDEGEFKYYVMDVPSNQCRLYNEDHTLFKTIDLSVPAGYFLNDIKYISRRTFNSDDYIELLYLYYKVEEVNSQSVYTYGLKVVSENGDLLLNKANGGFAEIKEFNGEAKLLTYQYIWNDTYYLVYTDVYSIYGSTNKSVEVKSSRGLRIAPNPINKNLSVYPGSISDASNGEIIISDIKGRQILNQTFFQGDRKINIATDDLPPGSYILNVVTEKGIVESEKIIKNK
jgi:hypothetical protein